MSMKKSSYTIGNLTRGLPVCSAVPQPLHHCVPPFILYFTLEKRHQYFLKLEQTVIIENSEGKRGRFLKKCDKCQRSSTADRDIEAINACKSLKIRRYEEREIQYKK
jgi:hypothetical protein